MFLFKKFEIFAFTAAVICSASSVNAECFITGTNYRFDNGTSSATVTTDGAKCNFPFGTNGSSVFTSRTVVSKPNNGTLTEIGLMRLEFVPKPGFKGTDSFTVKLCGNDSGKTGCNTRTYNIKSN